MNIEIREFIEGAKEAKGLTVIIDVFRAFTVTCYAKDNGAKRIIPVGGLDLAYSLKKDHPEYVLIGERKGVQQEGCDFGNSPADIEKIDFTGKTIIHTTSAGTQGLVGAINADEIITGSFVNAKAIVRYIKSKNPAQVTLVAMGNNGVTYAQEDTLCANYIKALLLDQPVDEKSIRATLKKEDGSKFFDPAMNHIFPMGDFDLCLNFNRFDFILKVEPYDEKFVELVLKTI